MLEFIGMVFEINTAGVGVTLNSLGKVYHELGLLTKGLAVLQRSQNISANFFGSDYPQVSSPVVRMTLIVRLVPTTFVRCSGAWKGML